MNIAPGNSNTNHIKRNMTADLIHAQMSCNSNAIIDNSTKNLIMTKNMIMPSNKPIVVSPFFT